MNKFKIIVPLYNVEDWIKKCIKSIQLQSYNNFDCYLVDDISTDNSANIIQELIANDSRFTLVQNKEKKFALRNIYESILMSGDDPEDIIVTLDGDDWFATKHALQTLSDVYDDNACYMTYGSYVEFPSMSKGKFCKQIPPETITTNSYRQSQWYSAHIRTIKIQLCNSINL